MCFETDMIFLVDKIESLPGGIQLHYEALGVDFIIYDYVTVDASVQALNSGVLCGNRVGRDKYLSQAISSVVYFHISR